MTQERHSNLLALFRDPHTPPEERPLLIARHLGLVGSSLTKQDIAFLSNLRLFFEHAEDTGTDLLHPPEDFHGWLAVPLTRSRKEGMSQISNNTYNDWDPVWIR